MSSIMRKVIYTPNAPVMKGIYSQAIVIDRTVYVAGQVGLDPKTGQLVDGGVLAQTKQILDLGQDAHFASFKDVQLAHLGAFHTIHPEMTEALVNMGEILKAAGCDYKNVVKTTVLLTDINDFAGVNDVYKQFFQSHCPARAAYQVVALPKNGLVEIEAVAVVGPIVDA